MILYKYVSFDAGQRILETSTIGFSQPKYFNDPFDMPAYPDEPSIDPIQDAFGRLRIMGKEHIWAESTGILSLTRTPINPLMWAHYADKHRGMVIGIDAVAAGFTSEERNLIPAQYGSAIYVSQRPNGPFIGRPTTGLAVGSTHHFPHDHYEQLQRLFLHKPLCWSYEEEVRVLKCLEGASPEGAETPSGRFSVADHKGQPLHLLAVPGEALREVYFGFRTDDERADEMSYRAREAYPHLSIFECKLLPDSFAVGVAPYITIAEAVAG